ncbi:hypothetical protein EI77_01229 [Prosthecobacter fusiformis]|uniref:Uncharacterized protein n=1 Tax=Prosthecobacter fusiformis TaxID=48464 RepID=A0A4R7S3D1_9BACT|nr:hypothetical protein [Prosthecobacter fusiformis]TDU72764.1 hypothetical protein EI77_01229 [Prosthecobacter fusiformis]
MAADDIPEKKAAVSVAGINPDDHQKSQNPILSGCACLGKAMMMLMLVGFFLLVFSRLMEAYIASDYGTEGYSKTRSALMKIGNAIGSYQSEYKKFPLPDPYPKKDVSLRTEGAWMAALVGTDITLNPKGFKFLEMPAAENGKSGVYQDKDEWVVTDLWGEKYYVVLDVDLDRIISNPEPLPNDAGDEVNYSIMIYSSGADRNPDTWGDNIGNWR